MEDHQHPTTEPTPGIAEADAAAAQDGCAGCCGSSDNNAVTTTFEEDAAEAPPLEEQDLPPDTECMCDKEDDEMPAVDAGKAAAVSTDEAADKRTAEVMEIAKVPAHVAADAVAKKKRLCRYPGCVKVIKSQGHCQRHGAKAKRCKVEGCDKQAQGTHDGKELLFLLLFPIISILFRPVLFVLSFVNLLVCSLTSGMCKRHWKAANFPEEITKKGTIPPEPEVSEKCTTLLFVIFQYGAASFF